VHGARGLLTRRRGPLVALGLLSLALPIYLPFAINGGWYYDDWGLFAGYKAAGSSWLSQFEKCTETIPAGRTVSCLYHVTQYHLFTDHYPAYHLLAIAFLVAMAWMAYAILVRVRVPWYWAALVGALLIVFPASDSTRFWASASFGQYVIVLELGGVLLALWALRSAPGRDRLALHVASLLLMLLAMATYEIAVPLVALNGIVYWAACRNREALRRGIVDFGLAVAFVLFRLVFVPVDPSKGFTVHRTIGGNVSRAWTLVENALRTWHETFLAGPFGTVLVLLVLVLAVVATVVDPTVRQRLRPWAALFSGAVVIGLAGTLVYQTANDLYLPHVGSLFNRVVLPASIAYVCAFVALLGIAYELIDRFVGRHSVAATVIAVILLLSAWHQIRISSDHADLWEASWAEQKVGIAAYDDAAAGLPEHSRFIGFGLPIYEPEFIPILAARWDLRGAINYTTPISSRTAAPFLPGMSCGVRALVIQGRQFTPYEAAGEPLYFLDAASREAVLVSSQDDCRRLVERWGRPPIFAL
jgi:hypothetical protein